MCINQIADMHVITNTSSIGCVVICAENGKCIAFAVYGIQHKRNQVRLRFVKLPNFTLGVSASYIKIAENDAFHAKRSLKISQNVFYGTF